MSMFMTARSLPELVDGVIKSNSITAAIAIGKLFADGVLMMVMIYLDI